MSAEPHPVRDDLYARGYDAAMQEIRQQEQVRSRLLRQQEQGRSRQIAPSTTPVVAPLPSLDPADSETFGALLARLRRRLQLSRNRLAHEAGCDPSYLTRIEHEERDPPRRHLVDALARVLFLNEFDYRQFVVAAGYAPVREWTRELEAAHRGRK